MGYENVSDRDALAGELLADTRHECNNQLAYVISNLQNLVEYASDLSRVLAAYRARIRDAGLLDAELIRLETETDLDFIVEDAGRAARDGATGAWRLRDILRTLAGLSGDGIEGLGPTVDVARLTRDLVGLMGKAISMRGTLELAVDGEIRVAAGTLPLTRVVVAMVKHALGGLDPRERRTNTIRIAVSRTNGDVELVVEHGGSSAAGEAHGLERIVQAARDVDAKLGVEPTRTSLRWSHP